MRKHLRTSYTERTTVIDKETGEILSEETHKNKYMVGSKEEFWLMYSSMVCILKGSKDLRMRLFGALLEDFSSGQTFGMSTYLKESIAKKIDCNPRSLENALTTLVADSIVYRIARNTYRINPRHVFQGSSHERDKSLRAIIELGCEDC